MTSLRTDTAAITVITGEVVASRTYAHWTPDSGTTEIPSLRRGLPLAEQPTAEVPFPWFLPSPPTRVHVTPRQAWSRRWRTVRHSPFAADVATGLRRGMAVLGVLAIAWAVFEIGRAFYLATQAAAELLAAFGWLIP